MKDDRRKMKDEGRRTKRISSVRELETYRLAFDTAMEIFEISKSFPKEEKYSLTDQIRILQIGVHQSRGGMAETEVQGSIHQ
jgi:hypothetical protein